MKEFVKPPIGATPYWMFAQERIKDLSGAIDRYINSDILIKENAVIIKRWADEIVVHCNNIINKTI